MPHQTTGKYSHSSSSRSVKHEKLKTMPPKKYFHSLQKILLEYIGPYMLNVYEYVEYVEVPSVRL